MSIPLRLRRLRAGSTGGSVTPPVEPPATVGTDRRITIWGQSNAIGWGAQVSQISGSYATETAPYLGPIDRVFIFDITTGQFAKLDIGVNNQGGGESEGSTIFGPELGIATRWMQRTTAGNLYIEKQASPDKQILHFMPGNAFYAADASYRAAAAAWLSTRGINAVDSGWIWVQGEGDAAVGTSQATYLSRLTTLIAARVSDGRQDAATSQNVLCRVGTASAQYSAAVEAAKTEYAAAHPSNSVCIDYVNSYVDSVHLASNAMVELGYDAFDAIPGLAVALWSQLFASATDGTAIHLTQRVLFDMPNSPNYGPVMLMAGAEFTPTKAFATRLNCHGIERMPGSKYLIGTATAPHPYSAPYTLNATGPRNDEANNIVPANSDGTGGGNNLTNPAHAITSVIRGMMGMPGSIRRVFGERPAVIKTKLGANIVPGATVITLSEPVDWKAGWLIEVTATEWIDSRNNGQTYGIDIKRERFTIAADTNNSTSVSVIRAASTEGGTIPAGTGAQFPHYGRMQYVVPPNRADIPGTCLSNTYYAIQPNDDFGTVMGQPYRGQRVLDAAAAGAPLSRDDRAVVALLTFPVKMTCPLDADRTVHGYGYTDMTMGLDSEDIMVGFEISNAGKAGQLGAYPLHWHMRSYTPYGSTGNPGSGTYLGDLDPTKNYYREGSVRDSSNRAITIHGTCGAVVEGINCCKIDTHAIFLEDGSERRYRIRNNLVSGVYPIGYGKSIIKNFDREDPIYWGAFGPAGVWLTSPDGLLEGNIVHGAFHAYWHAFSFDPRDPSPGHFPTTYFKGCFGQSRDVLYVPARDLAPNARHLNNECGPTKFMFARTEPSVNDEAGNIGQDTFIGFRFHDDTGVRDDLVWTIEGFRGFKAGHGWYYNHANSVLYKNWNFGGLRQRLPRTGSPGFDMVFKDQYLGIHGNVSFGQFEGMLLCAHTLDDPKTNMPNPNLNERGTLMLSYGNGVNRRDSVFIGAQMDDVYDCGEGAPQSNVGHGHIDTDGGVMSTWDFYVYPQFPPHRQFYNPNGINSNNAIIGPSVGILSFHAPPNWMCAAGEFGTYLQDKVRTGRPYTQGATRLCDNTQNNWHPIRLPADGSMFNRTGWWAPNIPYFTYGISGTAVVAPAPTKAAGLNGVIVDDVNVYYGIEVFEAGNPGQIVLSAGTANTNPEIVFTRLQNDWITPVSGPPWWTPKPPVDYNAYSNMRHGSCLHGGAVKITFPETTLVPPSKALEIRIQGITDEYAGLPANAKFTTVHPWDAATNIASCKVEYFLSTGMTSASYGNAGSLPNLKASPTPAYFRDTSTNLLYLNHCIGNISPFIYGIEVVVKVNKA